MAELVPIPFGRLLKRMYHEYQTTESIFDFPSAKFYHPSSGLDLSVSFCGNTAANPAGPAAGPHTQLAQNIVLSWLAGARIVELKTVQIKDQLQLSRPCIDIATVGYNTEWSQELRLEESLREYVKASMMIEMLQRSFHVPAYAGTGFQFQKDRTPPEVPGRNLETILDISVGYDLAGIQSPQIRSWLQTMRNATGVIEELRKEIPEEFAPYRRFPFKTEIGNSITLSTFHGTPASEIERICEFLLEEMGFHVIIKMNPPMLGRDRLEHLLFEKLGYRDIEVNRHAFDVSITFSDAVDVVRRLESVAARNQRTIGVKFGNTLEVINKGRFLKEQVQYLSGQPLHVLHLALVDEWRRVFGAAFPISFSAGVDLQNFADCVGTGLVPVTTCTDLLRPGGYGRLQRYLVSLEKKMKQSGAANINEFVLKSAQSAIRFERRKSEIKNLHSAILSNTSELLRRAEDDPRYRAEHNGTPPKKIGSHLHLWDCINCDKCIPVCPNDANFVFEVEPIDTQYKNIQIESSGWSVTSAGRFLVKESHQIATFADACNDCGNCDVFCPEDGGPYVEKPRFFGSVASWRKAKKLDGFALSPEDGAKVLYGRFGEREYRLALDGEEHVARFSAQTAHLEVDWESGTVLNASTDAAQAVVVDMGHFHAMAALLRGMMSSKYVNFVNAEFL